MMCISFDKPATLVRVIQPEHFQSCVESCPESLVLLRQANMSRDGYWSPAVDSQMVDNQLPASSQCRAAALPPHLMLAHTTCTPWAPLRWLGADGENICYINHKSRLSREHPHFHTVLKGNFIHAIPQQLVETPPTNTEQDWFYS